ncbi:MAG: hypothetical protein E7677_04535 [Ruminococcaceae bacterium]|nr:hypothetical protein [Oscillospiraceae bacterium]
MKKIKLILALTVALAMLLLVACNGNKTDKEELYVEYKNVKIVMGADADEIIDALGEPIDSYEIGDCGGLGAQVLYSYPSLDVYVLESKSGDVIDAISFRDDIVTTNEGVYIGMDINEAKELLGEPDGETDKQLDYKKGDFTVSVLFADGAVSAISYETN